MNPTTPAPAIPPELSAYFRAIGQRGGLAKSERKRKAAARNAKKARKRKAKKTSQKLLTLQAG